ncbi:P-loop containing nucleoside triphosphate hydrolase protein [Limtongia smithiae]|uniref:P-loop containing nucleoside triphosphate hydrolase protein n=1 Tax=Limtongia smithiae TaxID=1125753 RepID=UPI0034CF5F63
MTDFTRVCPDLQHTPANDAVLATLESANLLAADIAVFSASVDALATRTKRSSRELATFLDAFNAVVQPAPPRKVRVKRRRCDDEESVATTPRFITTGDKRIDASLFGGRGVPTGCITEVAGKSGAGKSNLLMQLCVAVQLSPAYGGLGRRAVYISTEAGLETRRLYQILTGFRRRVGPREADLLRSDNVLCITCSDLEVQDHIIKYQLPVLIRSQNVGLVVLDSIASHYRAEYEGGSGSRGSNMYRRSAELLQCACMLRDLARKYDCAVVAANQVKDQFITRGMLSATQAAATVVPDTMMSCMQSTMAEVVVADVELPVSEELRDENIEILALDNQSRFFSGWNWLDYTPLLSDAWHFSASSIPSSAASVESNASSTGESTIVSTREHKVPAMGHVWTTCVAQRVVLKREEGGEARRYMQVVFSPYFAGGEEAVEFEICSDGLRTVGGEDGEVYVRR